MGFKLTKIGLTFEMSTCCNDELSRYAFGKRGGLSDDTCNPEISSLGTIVVRWKEVIPG